jgi:excisionase family DNA binding protein
METTTSAAAETTAASGLGQPRFKLMYRKSEAAEMLSVSVRTLENLIAGKQLIVRRVGKRVLIPYQSLVQFCRGDHSTGKVN